MKTTHAKVGEVATLQLGLTFRGADASQHDPEGTHVLIRIGDLSDDGELQVKETTRVRLDQQNIGRVELRKGDVLVAARGTRMTAAVFDGSFPAMVGSQFCIVRPNPERTLPAYLRWFLNLPATQENLISRSRGSYVRSLPVSALADLDIPIPSIQDQHLIAQIHELRLREHHLLARLANCRTLLVDRTLIQALNQ